MNVLLAGFDPTIGYPVGRDGRLTRSLARRCQAGPRANRLPADDPISAEASLACNARHLARD